MLRPEVAPVSQVERLRTALASSAVTHGQTVRADIEEVEVSTKAFARALVFFCGMRGVTVSESVADGDGAPLPAEAEIHGLKVEREGFYNIRNALITSNGKIDITLDDRSAVVPARRFPMSVLFSG